MLEVTQGIGARARTRTQCLFSVLAPPFPLCHMIPWGQPLYKSLHTDIISNIKGRVSYCGRQKAVVRNIKRNLLAAGVPQ